LEGKETKPQPQIKVVFGSLVKSKGTQRRERREKEKATNNRK